MFSFINLGLNKTVDGLSIKVPSYFDSFTENKSRFSNLLDPTRFPFVQPNEWKLNPASMSKIIESALENDTNHSEESTETEEVLSELDSLKGGLIKRFNERDRTESDRNLITDHLSRIAKRRFEIKNGNKDESIELREEIARGKAKRISDVVGREDVVLLTPLRDDKLKEIQDEVELAQIIKETLKRKREPLENANLAIEFKVLKQDEWIEGKYTVEMPRAKTDLEKMINNNQKKLSFTEGMRIVWQIANGIKNLHHAGYVHGDLKPENVLMYKNKGKYKACIADFGKTKPLSENERRTYSGNPRFCSPERGLSFKGEVFSTALMMIRVLEAEFLDESKDMLIPPDEVDKIGEHGRQGVEKFVVLNKKCLQSEPEGLITRGLFYAKKGLKGSASAETENEIHLYITALIDELRKKYGVNEQSITIIESLNVLLKQMTLSNPEKRPSMKEVADWMWKPEVKDIQHILTNKTLKIVEEVVNIVNVQPFLISQQFFKDVSRARYFLNGQNLASIAYEKLKKERVISSCEIGLGQNVRGNNHVAVHHGVILAEAFGHQSFLNIGSIAQQSSSVHFLEKLSKENQDYVFGSFLSQPPEYYIEDQNDKVQITLVNYLKGNFLGSSSSIENDKAPCYAMAKRVITISKEDLGKDWGEDIDLFVAPSLKVEGYYSEIYDTVDEAKLQMIEKGLISEQHGSFLDRLITEDDISSEQASEEQVSQTESIDKQLDQEDIEASEEQENASVTPMLLQEVHESVIPAENKLNSLETNVEEFWSLGKLFSEDSENEEDMFPEEIAGTASSEEVSEESYPLKEEASKQKTSQTGFIDKQLILEDVEDIKASEGEKNVSLTNKILKEVHESNSSSEEVWKTDSDLEENVPVDEIVLEQEISEEAIELVSDVPAEAKEKAKQPSSSISSNSGFFSSIINPIAGLIQFTFNLLFKFPRSGLAAIGKTYQRIYSWLIKSEKK